MQQTWRATDILGLTPAVDSRRAQGIFALGGKNYAFDSQGPRSCFGNRLLSTFQMPNPEHMQGVRLSLRGGDRVFLFEATSIVEWNEAAQEYTLIFGTPDTTNSPFRWTSGYLNGKMYFCHPIAGVIIYDVQTSVAALHSAPGVPTQGIALCVDNGRLCIIDDLNFYFSAQSDGTDFVPRLGGAGFQAIADRVSGFPIMLHSYAKGVLVWTSGGVLRCEFTGDELVYHIRNLNTEYRPVNSFCTAQMDDNTVIILDERGFFKSSGELPVPLTPLFNEFLIKYLQENKLKLGQNVRLEWDKLQRFLYLSISTSFVDPIYEKAFVLYPPLDKWGSFDEPHYGIVPARIANSEREGDYFGFVGTDARIRYWRNTGSRESGTHDLMPLDASIRIGLIRFDDLRESNDQLIEVNQLMIGNVLSGEPGVLNDDFNLIPAGQDEDYNSISGAEDLGFERLNYINHKTRLIGTIDGSTVYVEEIPELINFTTAARYYSCSVPGIWMILELKADEIGELFHMRAFELTATYAGKL